jgi:hypothetical protein
MNRLIIVFLTFCSLSVSAENKQSEMLNALSTIHGVFQSGYGPRDWKEAHHAWSLDGRIECAKAQVLAEPDMTVREFQQIVADFFRSTNDYHVGVAFTSTESSSLGFQVKSAEGRTIIVHVNRKLLAKDSFPFEVGDELVTFDGVPIQEVLEDLKAETGLLLGPDATEQSLAEIALTKRSWRRGQECPQGKVLLGLKRKGTDIVRQHELLWVHKEEMIKGMPGEKISALETAVMRQGVASLYTEATKTEAAGNPHAIGAPKNFLPDLGEVTWNGESSVHRAYTYLNDAGQTIGYVRIPDYGAAPSDWFTFAKIVNHMEENTDALVIDQLSNPGGYLFQCLALVSMFATDPLPVPPQCEKINQGAVMRSHELVSQLEGVDSDAMAKFLFMSMSDPGLPITLFGLPVTHQFIRGFLEYNKAVLSEWGAGRTLTQPLHWWGMRHINPNPYATYSKPILLLINELDFSCGDYFPSILQDGGRVTTMGCRTAGAGGYVLSTSFPNSLGIEAFRYTGSVGLRTDQNPIEDLGVTPDICYEPTLNDLCNDYEDYAQEINIVISELIGG